MLFNFKFFESLISYIISKAILFALMNYNFYGVGYTNNPICSSVNNIVLILILVLEFINNNMKYSKILKSRESPFPSSSGKIPEEKNGQTSKESKQKEYEIEEIKKGIILNPLIIRVQDRKGRHSFTEFPEK